MLAPGHVVVGLTTYMGICAFYGYQPEPELYAAAALGALLPDIDHPQSRVGKMFPHISKPLAAITGHRGFTHSLLAVGVFMCVLFMSVEHQGESMPAATITALSLGYLSHLLADFCTLRGIPLLWPYQRGAYYGYRLPVLAFRTGGKVEMVLTTLLGVLWSYNVVY